MIYSSAYLFARQISPNDVPVPTPVNQYNVQDQGWVSNIAFEQRQIGDSYWGYNVDSHFDTTISASDFWFDTNATTNPQRAALFINRVILYEADGSSISYENNNITIEIIQRAYDYFMSNDKAAYVGTALIAYPLDTWAGCDIAGSWYDKAGYGENGRSIILFTNTARFRDWFVVRSNFSIYTETNVPIFLRPDTEWIRSGTDADFAKNVNAQLRAIGILGQTLSNP